MAEEYISLPKSYNTLVIESIIIEVVGSGFFQKNEATLNAKVVFRCLEKQVDFKTIKMVASGKSLVRNEAIQRAIQCFLDGQSQNDIQIEGISHKSISCDEIHDIHILLPEPYKLLFKQLFDAKEWRAPTHVVSPKCY